jgi:transcription initiation factor TFIIB
MKKLKRPPPQEPEQYYTRNECKIDAYLASLPNPVRLAERPFNKKKIKIYLLDEESKCEFPNAMLMEESIFEEPESEPVKVHRKDIMEMMDEIVEEHSETPDKKTNTSEDVCVNCGESDTVEDQKTSNLICSNCGTVIDVILDQGPEWRSYAGEDSRGSTNGRCGAPTNPFFPKSFQGSIIVGINSKHLKKKQGWSQMTYRERSYRTVCDIIVSVCAKWHIRKSIADDASVLYRILSECPNVNGKNTGGNIIIRGKNRLSVIAACLYKACERNEQPRTIKEISNYFDLEEKKVTRGIRRYDNIMLHSDIRLDGGIEKKTDIAEDFIRRHCPRLRICLTDTDMAVRIANNCSRMKLASDHNPQSIAAGAILTMVRFQVRSVTIDSIAKLFGTSVVTINKIYAKLIPYVEALVDDEITNHLIKKFNINGEEGETNVEKPKKIKRLTLEA